MATQEERSVFLKSPIQEELCQSLIRSWIEEGRGRLGLVVVGEAGQGKSSLNNGLLGKQVATEAWSLDQETPIVEKYSYFENGIAVTLLDTPGFGVDKLSDEETLQEMVKQFSGEDSVDLMLYCIRMDGTRWPKTTDKKTIDKMTKFFGPEIWQCCQFVLTFANQVMGLCPPGEEREGFFTYKIWQYEEKVRKTLIEYAHLTEEDVTQIHVVPVGDPHQHQNKSWELPGIDDWFLNFWLECTCSIRQSALPALIKLNRHRITEMPEDISSPNPPALYQHHVPSYAAELPEPAAGTSSEPQYAGLEAPDQCEPASNEPSSPMPSLTQSHDNSSINIDQVESQQLTAPPTIDDGAESPQLASNQATENPTNGLESHPISLYRILQNLLKNEKSGFLQYITTYLNKRGNQVPVFGYFEGVIEGLISWLGREPTTAVRKMPQHQLLAEDIQENFLEQGKYNWVRIIETGDKV